ARAGGRRSRSATPLAGAGRPRPWRSPRGRPPRARAGSATGATDRDPSARPARRSCHRQRLRRAPSGRPGPSSTPSPQVRGRETGKCAAPQPAPAAPGRTRAGAPHRCAASFSVALVSPWMYVFTYFVSTCKETRMLATRDTRYGLASAAEVAGKSGKEVLQAIIDGTLPQAPISRQLSFWITEVGDGFAAFEGEPGADLLNPMGGVH